MRKKIHSRGGTVAVLCAFCLVVVLSFVAIAIDGGGLMDDRRRAQSAADAAAMAGAADLFAKWQTNTGVDKQATAVTKATAAATANGFPAPEVYCPPQTGPFAGQAGYIEVIVSYNQKRAFSRIWGSTDLPVKARAVAQGRWAANKMGILVLDPAKSGSLTNTGGGVMNVVGVPTIVDSNAPDAVTATGNGTINSEVDVVGNPGISGSGTWSGPIIPNSPPVPDPLKYLPEPDPNTMTLQGKNPTHISGQNTTILQPGVYHGGITVSGQGKLVMKPGIYYMDGGGFSFTGQGGMDATGVLIFNAPKSNSDIININGIGSINFSPPTTGIYRGIALWQQRSSTNNMNVAGNGTSSMSGTFYTARGTLNVQGNGSNDTIGSQYISYNLTINGNGNFKVNWDVDLTGKIRLINLVE